MNNKNKNDYDKYKILLNNNTNPDTTKNITMNVSMGCAYLCTACVLASVLSRLAFGLPWCLICIYYILASLNLHFS